MRIEYRRQLHPCASWRWLVVAVLLGACAACTPDSTRERFGAQPLVEGWQFRWGDSPHDAAGRFTWLGEGADAAGWSSFTPPQNPPGRGENRYLWMRIRLPEALPPLPAVYFKYIDQNYEVFLDGRLLQRFGDPGHPEALVEGRPWRVLPLGADAAGKVLALRIYSEHTSIGPHGTISLGSVGRLESWVVAFGTDDFVLVVLLLAFGLASACLYLYRRKDPLIGYFSAFTLCSGLYTLSHPYAPLKQLLLDRPGLWWHLDLGTLFVLPVFYLGFYECIANPDQRRIVRWMRNGFILYFSGAVALTALGVIPLAKALQPYVLGLSVCIVISLGLAFREAKRGDRNALVYLVGLLAVALAGMRDSWVDQRVLQGESYASSWGFIAFAGCLAVFIVRRYMRIVREHGATMEELGRRNAELTEARRRIAAVAEQVRVCAEQIQLASAQQARVATEQAASNQETSVTVREIAHTAERARERASGVIETARQSEALSRDGQSRVEQVAHEVEQLSRQVQQISAATENLSSNTASIGQIVHAVQEIAEQSNLLALNAAIEAARVGEQGRGFAIVAKELRQLADESKEAMGRVRTILVQVQDGAESAIRAVEEGNRAATNALALAQGAGQAITGLADVILQSSRAAEEIAQTTHQQADGVEQILGAVTTNADALTDTVEGTRRIEEGARSLSELSRTLTALAVAREGVPFAPAEGEVKRAS